MSKAKEMNDLSYLQNNYIKKFTLPYRLLGDSNLRGWRKLMKKDIRSRKCETIYLKYSETYIQHPIIELLHQRCHPIGKKKQATMGF